MLAWLFAPSADLLGASRLRGPMPWVVAIMSFSIIIIAATGLVMAEAAGSLSGAIQTRYALQVPDGGQKFAAVVAALKSEKGVTSVTAVPIKVTADYMDYWHPKKKNMIRLYNQKMNVAHKH